MKKIFSVLTVLSVSFQLFSQTDVDALRFSQLNFGGTARGMGLGGAFGAVGADFTSLSINPAGLGLYRSSEFMLTPAIFSSNTETDFINSTTSDRKYNFNFTNWGFVITSLKEDKKDENKKGKWASFSFALGANRLVNFHNRFSFQGYNPNNSLLDKYLEDVNANGGTLENDLVEKNAFQFTGALAWHAFLINLEPSLGTNQYSSIISNGEIMQSGTLTTKGAIDEYDVSFGANYNNKLSLGATLGLPYIHYTQNYDYTEEDVNNVWNQTYYFNRDTNGIPQDSVSDFQSFNIKEDLTTKGMGINLKMGAIYRPADWVRIGAAIHTPSFYSLKDYFSTQMSSTFAIQTIAGDETLLYSEGQYEYNLTTPFRAIGSLALIYKKIGFVTVDYEWLDYGQANFNFNTGDASNKFAGNQVNKDIETKHGSASNIRLGAELSYDIFRLRGGYAMYGTPFKKGIATGNYDNSRNSISFGLGVREKDYFVDFAFVRATTKEYFSPYQLSYEATEGVSKKISQNNFVLTIGLKF